MQKDPPLLLVSIYVDPESLPVIQSAIGRERDRFPQRIYGILKSYLPHLQQVLCSVSQDDGWEISYPLPEGFGNDVSPHYLGHSLNLGLPGISSKKMEATIEKMREEGSPLGHRILSLAGISDTSKYLATDFQVISRIETVVFTAGCF